MISKQYGFTFGVLVSLLALGISACGHKSESEGPTQVVAKVNGDEISIHQVNFQLARLGQLDKEKSKLAAKEVLSKLVNQQLFKQKAIEAKLDRDPRVLQAIEASKNEILATVYLEQQMAKAAKPTTLEVDEFYQQNPALFEKRRIYRLQELAVQVGEDKLQEIQDLVKASKGMNEIAAGLKVNNYEYTANSNVIPAEKVPAGLLAKLQNMADGNVIVVNTGRSINIVQIAASQSQPVSRENAGPIIQQYFINKNKNELAAKEVTKLHQESKIEYLGVFADMKDAGKTAAATAKPVDKPTDKAVAAKPDASVKDKSAIEKGVSGL